MNGDGLGVPNQEFVLSAASKLPERTVLDAGDTDGIGGPTTTAGGPVAEETISRPRSAQAGLANNAAYYFLRERDALLYSEQTGTNVNDLRILVVPE